MLIKWNVPVCKLISAVPTLRGARSSQTRSATVSPSESPGNTRFLPSSQSEALCWPMQAHTCPTRMPEFWSLTKVFLSNCQPTPGGSALRFGGTDPPPPPHCPAQGSRGAYSYTSWGWPVGRMWPCITAGSGSRPLGQGPAEPTEFTNENGRHQPKTKSKEKAKVASWGLKVTS